MTSRFSHRTLAIAAGLIMVTSLWGGMMSAQTVPPIPINQETGQCIPWNESPLSLYDIDGVRGPDADKQINPVDLDGDGFSNVVEFQLLSDPTDERSTPTDRDGDGVPSSQDPCDFNPAIPGDFEITLEASRNIVQRSEEFNATANVTQGGEPHDVQTVELTITMPDMTTRGPFEMTRVDNGTYNYTVETGLDDLNGEWILQATATSANGSKASVPRGGPTGDGDERPRVQVNPAEHAPILELLSCDANGDNCEQRDRRFFLDEVITVRAIPAPGRIDLGDPATETAVMRFTVTNTDDDETPEFAKVMERSSIGGTVVWQATLDPSDPADNPFFPSGLATAEHPSDRAVLYSISVEAEDNGLPDPNVAFNETEALASFVDEFRIVVTTPEDPTPRGGTIEFIAELQRANQTGSGWITVTGTTKDGTVLLRTLPAEPSPLHGPDANGRTIDEVDISTTGDGIYTGEYTIQLGDFIEEDELGNPEPNYYATFTIEDETLRDVDYPVEPADIPGSIETDKQVYNAVIDEEAPAPNIVIQVNYTIEGPFFDDGDGVPGTANATVFTNAGARIGGAELAWVPARSQFEGTVEIPAIFAVAAGGSWTVQVDHQDDAKDAPNRGSDSTQVSANAQIQPAGVQQSPTRANITLIAGANTPNLDGPGLTENPAFDVDTDGEYSHRYIVIRGNATPQTLIAEDEGIHSRNPTLVGVQFHDFGIEGVDVYFAAVPDNANNGFWEVVVDTQRYCVEDVVRLFCDNLNGFDGAVSVNAFAYAGEIAEGESVSPNVMDRTTYLAGDPTGTFGPLETESFEFVYKGPTAVDNFFVLGDPIGGGPAMEMGPGANISKNQSLTFRVDANDAHADAFFADVEMGLVRARFANCFSSPSDPQDYVFNTEQAAFDDGIVFATSEWCLEEHYRPSGVEDPASNYDLNGNLDDMEPIDATGTSVDKWMADRWQMVIPGPLVQSGSWPSNNERFWIRMDATNALGYRTFIDSPNLHRVTGESGINRHFGPSTGQFGPDSPAVPDWDAPQFTFVPHDAKIIRVGPLYDWRADTANAPQRQLPELLETENGDAYWDLGEAVMGREDYSGGGNDRNILGLVSDETGTLEAFGEGYLNSKGTTAEILSGLDDITIELRLHEDCASLCGDDRVPGWDRAGSTVIAQTNLAFLNDARVNDDVGNDIEWDTTVDDLIDWAHHEMINWRHNNQPAFNQDHQLQGRVSIEFEWTTNTGIVESDAVYVQIDMNAFPDISLVDGVVSDIVGGTDGPSTPTGQADSNGPIIGCKTECELRFKAFDLDGVNASNEQDDVYGRHLDGIMVGERQLQPEDEFQLALRLAGWVGTPYQWMMTDANTSFTGFVGNVNADDGEFVDAFYNWTLRTVHPDADKRLPTRSNPELRDEIYADGTHHFGARASDGVEILDDITEDQQWLGHSGLVLGLFSLPTSDQPFLKFRLSVDNDADGDTWSNEFEAWVEKTLIDGTYRDGQPFYGQVGIDKNITGGLPLYNGTVELTSPSGATSTVAAVDSTPCDFDGDGVPNDVPDDDGICQNVLNLEETFHMHPFRPDSPSDDPNRNGIPNFADPFQTYRFDCADNDFDGYCNEEEQAAGSDPDNPNSVPGDANGNLIPDSLEQQLNPVSDTDGDGYGNREEIVRGSDPLDPCSTPENTKRTSDDIDGDGIPNRQEIVQGSDPLDPDDPNPRNC